MSFIKRVQFRSLFSVAICLLAMTVSVAADKLPVYILAGQSNMQGHAEIRTFDAMALRPNLAPLLAEMRDDAGNPRVCQQVWISSIGSAEAEQIGKLTVGFGAKETKIGPEFMFGITMEKQLKRPILLIKTAWGGKSINTDFRPPSAGPYVFNDTQIEKFKNQNKDIEKVKAEKAEETGHYYRLMMAHVKLVLADIKRVYPDYDPQVGYELAGFVWFQGWNDMVDGGTYPDRANPGGYQAYSDVLAHFIRDVRKELDAPTLPFVIGVMGVGGPTSEYTASQQRYKSTHQGFRDAMAAPASLPEFKGTVTAVLTEQYWDMEVSALREKKNGLKKELDAITAAIKEKKINRDEAQKQTDALLAKHFNERELTLLNTSTSNAEFHYMGSGGIMAQIGKGFAEAMLQLKK